MGNDAIHIEIQFEILTGKPRSVRTAYNHSQHSSGGIWLLCQLGTRT